MTAQGIHRYQLGRVSEWGQLPNWEVLGESRWVLVSADVHVGQGLRPMDECRPIHSVYHLWGLACISGGGVVVMVNM